MIMHYEALQTFIFVIILVELLFLTNFAETKRIINIKSLRMKKVYLILLCALIGAMPVMAQKSAPKRASFTLESPTVEKATNISSNGFTAHWQPVDGAEGYCIFVYTKDVAPADGEYIIIDEDFNGVDFGSLIEPGGGDEYGVNLSEMGYAFTYGWEAYAFPTFAPGLVAGLLYTPYLNLTNDNGNYKMHITTVANQNDVIRIESHGAGEQQRVEYTVDLDNSEAAGRSTHTVEMSNGSRDLFCSMINMTAPVGTYDYFDRVMVTQNLQAGDEVYTNIAADESIDAEDDWGTPITSKTFSLPSYYLNGHTVVYYDVYAAAYDLSTPNGSTPYTLVTSPYSFRVMVDLANHTSEVIEEVPQTGISEVAVNPTVEDNNYYDLTGRRVVNPTGGIYIHNGKKVIIH